MGTAICGNSRETSESHTCQDSIAAYLTFLSPVAELEECLGICLASLHASHLFVGIPNPVVSSPFVVA
ncbi:hypothetical protein K1719_040203 [Acacia pycnantha]|nr:hypothetical protein K1719_042934 [Acacia pycnantha]KAI9077857.1 hypothetical protein K1719_040203 [Acacia pycnantha]